MKTNLTILTILLSVGVVMGQSKTDTIKYWYANDRVSVTDTSIKYYVKTQPVKFYPLQSKEQIQQRIETMIKLIYEVKYPGIMPKNKRAEMLRVADSLLKSDVQRYNTAPIK